MEGEGVQHLEMAAVAAGGPSNGSTLALFDVSAH